MGNSYGIGDTTQIKTLGLAGHPPGWPFMAGAFEEDLQGEQSWAGLCLTLLGLRVSDCCWSRRCAESSFMIQIYFPLSRASLPLVKGHLHAFNSLFWIQLHFSHL